MEKWIFSETSRAPCNYLKVGDWVVYDCYDTDPLVSLGVVTAFEYDHSYPWVILRVWDGDHYKTVRRYGYDIKVGKMRKITNTKI